MDRGVKREGGREGGKERGMEGGRVERDRNREGEGERLETNTCMSTVCHQDKRDGGMEGWRDGGMEGWRDGGGEERE